MHCGLRKISCVFPAEMTTCAHSRSPRNNSVRPYLSCRSCVIPIATPQRWQIRAGVARTQAGRRTRTGAHAAFSFWRNHVGLFKINQAQSGCGSGIHAHRIPSWQTQNTRRRLWKRSGTSPCLPVCLCRLSACGLHAHYQNKQRWGWKNGVHTLNKTGGKKNQTPAQHQGIVSAGAHRLSQGSAAFSCCSRTSTAPADSINSRFSPLRL